MDTTRRPSRLCVLVLMALVLMALPAVPAAANHAPAPGPVVSGSGNVEGTEVFDDSAFTGTGICLRGNTIFGLRGDGTYHGRSDGGQEVVYRAEIASGQTRYGDGPIRLEVQNTETYYHGPYGTHGLTDSNCTPATAGSPIPAEFRLFAPDHLYRLDGTGAQIPCVGQGTFARGEANSTTFGNPFWRADWTLAEDCTVVGNEAGTPGSGVSPAGTAMQHHGKHGPCFSPPCVDNLKTDYKQYAPVPGPYLALSGPASADTGENATVVARLTDDGAPVADVPVTFSTTGPTAAVPPGNVVVTAADGTASFAFTALDAGDYTATATATYNAQVLSASHTVSFRPPPPLAVELSAPPSAQTEEDTKFVAFVTDGGDPTLGAEVKFSVSGPAPATPASASATTGTNGQASFAFRAEWAGDYTVTATATRLGQEASATQTVHLDINTFSVAASIPSEPGGSYSPGSAVIDPAGDFAYFGGNSVLEKVDLNTFQRVGLMSTSHPFESGVIDPAGQFAYFGGGSRPGRVTKVDLASMQSVGTIRLEADENDLRSAVIDPAGRYAYFGTDITSPARIVKVDLETFQRVGALVLPSGEIDIASAVMDPAGNYAYFGARGAGTSGALVVKVDLNTFERVGAVTVTEPHLATLTSAVIDAEGRFGYFGTGVATSRARSVPGQVVKVDLAALQPVGVLTLFGDERDLTAAVIDPNGAFAYFGSSQGSARPPIVVRVDLRTFQRVHGISFPQGDLGHLRSAVIHPAGDAAYFHKANLPAGLLSGREESPAKIYKVAVTRPPNPDLAVADDAYDTPYVTPKEVPAPGVLENDGPGLSAGQASDPAGGSVELRPDGSFTYTPDTGFSGTDTFTYVANDGRDFSPRATVSIQVGAAPEGVASVRGDAFGYHSNVSLFGGPYESRGPAPTVALEPTAANSPQTAHVDSAEAVYGPAVIFRSGPIDVAAEGATGPEGYADASSTVAGHPDPNERPGPLFYDGLASTCGADATGTQLTTTVTNGVVETSYHTGDDPNTPEVEQSGDPKTTEEVPANPPVGYVVEGTLDHIDDSFRIIFNEQTTNSDGSRTVTAAHMELLGPTAVGDVFIAQSRCGVELASGGGNTAPTAADDAYTTGRGTALTVPTPGVLANDTDADGDALTATSASAPANGTVTLNPDGSFTYTPAAGFVGTDTFTYTADDANGGTATATVTMTVEAPAAKARVADFDGDGDTDRSVFRRGAWYAEGQPAAFFGVSGDIPVPGDYDGDGTTERAIYRNGAWHIQGQPTVFLGNATDVPVPGDYDGDGDTERAIYRNGAWHIQGQPTVFLGNATDVPVPGDYDGDGDTEAAVYRNGAWHIHGQPTVFHGVSGDVPVPGDYDGDGDTEAAIYRNGAWHVAGQPTVFLGNASDVPVPGDYDANGSTDRGVFRPSGGGWYVQGQPAVFLGVKGDIPLPLPQAIYRAFF